MSATATDLTACPNCGAPLAGAFCAQCGQKVAPVNPTLHDLLHDAVHEFLHIDGRIVRSVQYLLLRPGMLTREYYAGRRLAARLLTIPGLGHAWSGGDAAYPFFDERYLDATGLVCDFFASH